MMGWYDDEIRYSFSGDVCGYNWVNRWFFRLDLKESSIVHALDDVGKAFQTLRPVDAKDPLKISVDLKNFGAKQYEMDNLSILDGWLCPCSKSFRYGGAISDLHL